MSVTGTTRVFLIIGDPVAQVRATIPHKGPLAALLKPGDPVAQIAVEARNGKQEVKEVLPADSIATFRRRFLPQIEALFVQVLVLAREMKCLKLGNISLDGTKIAANASKHRALSWEHANRIEAQCATRCSCF